MLACVNNWWGRKGSFHLLWTKRSKESSGCVASPYARAKAQEDTDIDGGDKKDRNKGSDEL